MKWVLLVAVLGAAGCVGSAETADVDSESAQPERASVPSDVTAVRQTWRCWNDIGHPYCDSWDEPYRFICSSVPPGCSVSPVQPHTPATAVCCASQNP